MPGPRRSSAMPIDLLDRLQENKLRTLEELVDSFHTAAMIDWGGDDPAQIADFIVDEGIGLRQGLMRFWELCWTAALAGKLRDRIKEGADIRALLDRGSAVLARAAKIARTEADRSGHQVARLVQFEEQTEAFPLWAEESMARWELLDRPHKPLDRDRIAAAQAAFQHG